MKKVLIFALAMLACTSCAAKKKVVQEQPQPVPQPVQQSSLSKQQAYLDSLDMVRKIREMKHIIELDEINYGREVNAANMKGTALEMPCVESSFDDETYFRDLGIGTAEGNNLQNCRLAAVKAAKGMIKERLGEFVQGVSTYYASSYSGSKDKNAVESKMASKLNGVVEKMLNDADKECDKLQTNARGVVEAYYVVRIPKYDLKKNMIDVMSKEEKDRIDFNEYQMQKFMDERMNDMLEAKKNAGY